MSISFLSTARHRRWFPWACKTRTVRLIGVARLGSLEHELEQASDKLIYITTIFQNLSVFSRTIGRWQIQMWLDFYQALSKDWVPVSYCWGLTPTPWIAWTISSSFSQTFHSQSHCQVQTRHLICWIWYWPLPLGSAFEASCRLASVRGSELVCFITSFFFSFLLG